MPRCPGRSCAPGSARADSGGLVAFGSTDCDTACSGNGPRVRSYGTFGSVEIATQGEYDAQQAGDSAQDAREVAAASSACT